MVEFSLKYPQIPIQKFAFFADESDITTARYSMVGGTAIQSSSLRRVYKRIFDLRIKHKMFAELKWQKISNQKVDAYREFIELYFELVERGTLAFHSATFDNTKWKHHLYNHGDRDLGLSKNYYQLILHQVIQRYGEQASLFVCLDRRHSSTKLPDLHRILNAGAAKDYGLTFGPITEIIARDSKKDDLLQLNDLILGATSSVKNGRHEDPKTRTSKAELAKLVLKNSGLGSYDEDSPPQASRFTVWNRVAR